MFKQLKTGIMKAFSKKWIIIAAAILLVIGLYCYSWKKHQMFDMMTTGFDSTMNDHDPSLDMPISNMDEEFNTQSMSDPSDLLPNDSNSQWASLNPITQGNVAIPDLLQSGYHIGLDSIGQSLKNANYQNRADPVIERKPTGLWNQSTIESDLGRVSME